MVRIFRVLLENPVLRYVDDLFFAERAACVEHCRDCVARLVRAFLGPDAMAGKTLCNGLPLEIL